MTDVEVCPNIDYRPESFTNELIKHLKVLAEEDRKAHLVAELKKDTLLIKSSDIVRILTEVKFGSHFRETLKAINAYILQISAPEMVQTMKIQKKEDQIIVVEELRDALSDVSQASKNLIAGGVTSKCAKNDAQIHKLLVNIKKRSCVLGKIAKNVVLIIDVSGSMSYKFNYQGRIYSRLEFLKPIIVSALKNFDESNNFKIIFFSTKITQWNKEFVTGTEANKNSAINFINGLQAMGATNTLGALQAGFATDRSDFNILLFSDGFPTVGVTNTNSILSWVQNENIKRITKGYKSVKIDINMIMLGGYESPRDRQITLAFMTEAAKSTQGTFKNFSS
jgi:hypothetical protein